jgi:hypothetical protein
MEGDLVYKYIKLFMDYFSLWSVMSIGLIIWFVRNPEKLKNIIKYISRAKFGDFEIQLRDVEKKLEETELHVSEIEEENSRLNMLYGEFDIHSPVKDLEKTRQSLKALAGNLGDLSPVINALKPKADHGELYAAAEILRTKRDIGAFDSLINCIDRIASDNKLEQIRFHTVWTLASAVHRTVLSAVKHTDHPKLTVDQLKHAATVMKKLCNNPHVQQDRPDQPEKGIRGPANYSLNWINKGLKKYDELSAE